MTIAIKRSLQKATQGRFGLRGVIKQAAQIGMLSQTHGVLKVNQLTGDFTEPGIECVNRTRVGRLKGRRVFMILACWTVRQFVRRRRRMSAHAANQPDDATDKADDEREDPADNPEHGRIIDRFFSRRTGR